MILAVSFLSLSSLLSMKDSSVEGSRKHIEYLEQELMGLELALSACRQSLHMSHPEFLERVFEGKKGEEQDKKDHLKYTRMR